MSDYFVTNFYPNNVNKKFLNMMVGLILIKLLKEMTMAPMY